ncbi:MAG TPA: ParA family protein [Burkholderiales bacterium]|nr:ParA family protein [Burkholderiales bacterium]
MNTTLVINSKGGSGKTTITTTLASYFAVHGEPTAVLDYDLQGSSLNWLRVRDPLAPKIHGANAAPQKVGLRSFGRHVPEGTRQLIIDAPAGASGLLLQDMLSRANCIVIPVQPSAIDIHATANFVRDLLLRGNIRARNIRLAVVANRVRKATPVYQPLERFLTSLGLTIVTRLSDSEAFVKAAETGLGIFEMDASQYMAEREQCQPLIEWVDVGHKVRTTSTVIEMPRVALAGRGQSEVRRDLVRTMPPRPALPPRPLLPAKAALLAKPQPAQPKAQLPAWLSRISQRFVE